MDTEKLMEEYNSVLKNQVAMKMRGGRKTDRSKTVYHSKHTIAKKQRSQRKAVATDLPSSEAILRVLRMRSGKPVRDFLHAEFEKRNRPVSTHQQQDQQQLQPRKDSLNINNDTPQALGADGEPIMLSTD
jgi:hypothetical protein